MTRQYLRLRLSVDRGWSVGVCCCLGWPTKLLGIKGNTDDNRPVFWGQLMIRSTGRWRRGGCSWALCLALLEPVPVSNRGRVRLSLKSSEGGSVHELASSGYWGSITVGRLVLTSKCRHVGDEFDAGLGVLCLLAMARFESLDPSHRYSRRFGGRRFGLPRRDVQGSGCVDQDLRASIDRSDRVVVLPIFPVIWPPMLRC